MGVISRLLASTEATRALQSLTEALEAEMPPALRKAGRYDQMVDALNRLPRPLAALGTLVLLGFAMVDPAGFAQRMTALAEMPEGLWWLIGAVLTFTFGAREAHYLRNRPGRAVPDAGRAASEPNAAVEEWQSKRP